MSSPKARMALESLGNDVRGARLRRGIAVADLAVRAGTSPSTIARLEKGDPGVGIGVLAGILVVLGLVERLADLIDIRKDDLVWRWPPNSCRDAEGRMPRSCASGMRARLRRRLDIRTSSTQTARPSDA